MCSCPYICIYIYILYIYIYIYKICTYIYIYIYIYIRRPRLSQGRGGAWDHRRCGTFFPNALHFPRATQAIAPSVHRPGATQATAISVHFPRATHATAISVSTAFQNATGRGRPFLQLQQVPEALAVSF